MMMEAVRTSETSVYFIETTRRYIPQGCHHQVYKNFAWLNYSTVLTESWEELCFTSKLMALFCIA
jgi:hypothetical protein